MKNNLSLLFRFSASLLLVGWLLYSIDFNEVWQDIPRHGWIYIILLFLVVNADRVLMSYKWRILLQAKNIAIPFGNIVKSYYVGTFWGIFLPSTVGGDVIRAYRLARQVGLKKDIASSVVLERLLGAFTGLLMSVVCLFIAFEYVGLFDWRLDFGALLILLLVVILIVFSFQGRIFALLKKNPLSEKDFSRKIANLYDSYLDYGKHRGALFRFVVWTAIEQCVPIIGVYLTALALGKAVSFWHVALFVPLVMTAAKIPMTLDGFGVREGLYVYLFSLVGISSDDAFVIGLISHVVANLALLPGFIYSSLHFSSAKNISSKELF